MDDKRDRKIDILRFIAIFCIILAHSQPPELIFQLRNFDVTLMVFLSGISFYLSNRDRKINFTQYAAKRFKRLIIPTWGFLTLFFIFFYLLSKLFANDYYFTIKDIFMSYSMISGIGYVWIMRVFFVVAIICPLILGFSNRIKNNLIYFSTLIFVYIVYSLLLHFNSSLQGIIGTLFNTIILQSIGYSLIAAFGIRFLTMSKRYITYSCLLFFSIFILLMVSNGFRPTQDFKYPPTLYYFSYGLFISLFLYLLLKESSFIYKVLYNRQIFFLAENSLVLYFWHIIPVYLLEIFNDYLAVISLNFITRFLFIIFIAIPLTFFHVQVKEKIKSFAMQLS